MRKMLRLSPEIGLPLEAVTRRMAVLAMSGAGKSNVCVVLAEQMFAAGLPWVAIDPKGDWWGVRSSGNGTGPGLPIPIIGGLHGDLPLEASAGHAIAEMVADRRLTCVLDVSEMTNRQDLWKFLADFGETLLRRNRDPLHLFLEEADEYLPQSMKDKGNLPRCLGVWQRLVKRGRFRGIGSTQITQRNASLNKDTLYQAELLIAMRAGGKGDRKAVGGWVEHHNAAAEIVASLPTLEDGEGWVSSPAWLRATQRVRFDRRTTFDSGATPLILSGSKRPPTTLADIDLGELGDVMRAAVDRARDKDPAFLHRRIRELESKLKTTTSTGELRESLKGLEDRIRDAEERNAALAREIEEAHRTRGNAVMLASKMVADVRHIIDEFETKLWREDATASPSPTTAPPSSTTTAPSASPTAPPPTTTTSRKRSTPPPSSAPAPAPSPSPSLRERVDQEVTWREFVEKTSGRLATCEEFNRMERAFMTALAQWGAMDKKRLLTLTRYVSSGKTGKAFARLVADGLATAPSPGRLEITELGLNVLGNYDPLPVGGELRKLILDDPRSSQMERKLLAEVFRFYPAAISKKDILTHAGYVSSGKTGKAFARMVAAGFATKAGSGMLRASDVLFEKWRRIS